LITLRTPSRRDIKPDGASVPIRSTRSKPSRTTMKGGVEVLTRYLAKELGGRKITVNVIAPGAIETDFGGGAVRDVAAVNQMVAAATALGRAGLPDDIGAAVAALLSPDLAWVTGQRLEVSGGQNL